MYSYSQGVPLSEIENRIAKLQDNIVENGLDGALILQRADLFYFSGTLQQCCLYVPAEGKPQLMVLKDYERAVAESPIESAIPISGTKEIPELLKSVGCSVPTKIGMELDVLPVNLYLQYSALFKNSSITDISTGIRTIRAVKSDYELGLMKKSAEMSDRVSAKVCELLQPGKTEIALAGEIEGFARALGHQGLVRMRLWGSELFYGHLMSGPSAAVPSYLSSPTGGYGAGVGISQGAGFRIIEKNEPVLVDFVFALDGYLSDQTRIYSAGKPGDQFIRAHEAMCLVEQKAVESGRPGFPTGRLYEIMVQEAHALGYGEFFMGAGEKRIRFTGHGVGIELDEFPFIAKGQKLLLEKGMTIALEPKAIIPGRGTVGIENTFVVSDNGLEPLTHFPEEIIVV